MAAAPVEVVLERLQNAYPEPEYELRFDGPLQLLVGAILAAQCTDERVNAVVPGLFARYPDARSLATADPAEMEPLLSTISFYRKKAEAIRACCQVIAEEHGGEVPRDIEQLVALPRVARKTANLVLTLAYRVPSGVVVDTHVARVAQRLGLSEHPKPEKIEGDLLRQIPETDWIDFGPRLTLLGRRVCRAGGPDCPVCVMNDICPKVGVTGR